MILLEDEKHVEKGHVTPLGPSEGPLTPSYVKVPAQATEPPSLAQAPA